MTDWRNSAACAGKPTEWFFAEAQMGRGDARNRVDVYAQARAVCARCPVVNDCLEWALSRKEYGFWGGKTVEQREALKRQPRDGQSEASLTDSEAIRRRLHSEGLTDPDIGAKVGKSSTAIREWRNARGLTPNAGGINPQMPAWRRELYRQLYDAGLTDQQIAEGSKSTANAVKHWRRRTDRSSNYQRREASA